MKIKLLLFLFFVTPKLIYGDYICKVEPIQKQQQSLSYAKYVGKAYRLLRFGIALGIRYEKSEINFSKEKYQITYQVKNNGLIYSWKLLENEITIGDYKLDREPRFIGLENKVTNVFRYAHSHITPLQPFNDFDKSYNNFDKANVYDLSSEYPESLEMSFTVSVESESK